MSTTQAKWAKGTKLMRDGNEVAELTNIDGPDEDQDEENVTSHQSPDGFSEWLMTVQHGGMLPLEGNFIVGDTAGQIGLINDKRSQTLQSFEIVAPNNVFSWAFNGYVKQFKTGYPVAGKIPFTASVRIQGKPNLNITLSTGMTGLTGVDSVAGALDIIPDIAVDTYLYTTTVGSAITYVKLTPVGADHTFKINGNLYDTGQQTGEIALGGEGTTTEITILARETNKVGRTYKLIVTRESGA